MKALRTLLLLAGLLALGMPQAFPAEGETNGPAKTTDTTRRILPNDALDVRLVGESDWIVITKVPENGVITFPMIGDVEVKGKSITEVARIVREKLMDGYFIKPDVVATITQFTSQTVSVTGEVGRPGPIELPTDKKIDLVDAIAKAGGLTRLAKKSNIELKRNGKVTKHDYDVLKGATDPSKRIYVEPDDQIYVQERVF